MRGQKRSLFRQCQEGDQNGDNCCKFSFVLLIDKRGRE